ncbi:hypothetical protein MULP_01026 [Mycobacterium liflandii 128FXT]|uniref:Uncharacterized protein n=1 Tax=Mycobacterium liflandii (strain 128FXT) TaxID=459424 RepID=L7V3I5_MYCL1|nr:MULTISPECIES: hypothetical protein [Mycobacterium ulcerans group]AGC61048.1 hypothetical protein MULP_01026 [Mycobacterium liflandii 128FXT]RFZ50737.1 hypothetical protein BB170200_05158 [Mycobacterium marinum]
MLSKIVDALDVLAEVFRYSAGRWMHWSRHLLQSNRQLPRDGGDTIADEIEWGDS